VSKAQTTTTITPSDAQRRLNSASAKIADGVAEIRDTVGELFDALKTLDIERATYKNKCAQLEGKKHGD